MFSLWPQNKCFKIVVNISNIPEIQKAFVTNTKAEKKYWSVSLTPIIYAYFIQSQLGYFFFWNCDVSRRFYVKLKE